MCVAQTAKRRRKQFRLSKKGKGKNSNARKLYDDVKYTSRKK